MHRVRICVLVAVACAAATGCQKSRSKVSGTVTVNGAPMELGIIAFDPVDPADGPKVGAKVMDGTYELDATRGPFPGPHRVELHWLKPTGRKVKNPDGVLEDERADALPPKYNTNTELTADIGSWSNTVNFDVTP
jgi:hypothetical protein